MNKSVHGSVPEMSAKGGSLENIMKPAKMSLLSSQSKPYVWILHTHKCNVGCMNAMRCVHLLALNNL